MKINQFSIHDTKAGAYLPPFNLPTTEMAIRTFTDTINDENHPFNKHPEDYTLFQISEFDDENGTITPLQTKKPIGNGLDFKIHKASNGDTVTHQELNEILQQFAENTKS